MEIVILPTPAEVGRIAAGKIAAIISARPTSAIGLATGSSPQGIYSDLARRVGAGEISFEQARGFALDEYVGIPLEHPESYASIINRDVVRPLGFDPTRVRVPDGRASDLEYAAKEYEAAIRTAGGIDIQILGIGANGHIGFNEPTSSFASRTRIKTLAPRTREDNARFFPTLDDVPRHCLTQGVATILAARHLVLMAFGKGKAEAVHHLAEGPVSAMWPATALQLHPHVTVFVDDAAASRLQLGAYYRETFQAKPSWQGI